MFAQHKLGARVPAIGVFASVSPEDDAALVVTEADFLVEGRNTLRHLDSI